MDRIHKLFWDCHIKNCEIEKEEISEEDLETIKVMDRDKIYKNFRTFIYSLLDFKNQVKNSEASELARRNSEFESIITKLESDGRAHIAKHYQLRLEIETYKNTIEELNQEINNEKNENKSLKLKISQQEKIIEQYKNRLEPKRVSSDARKKLNLIDVDQLGNNAKSSRHSTKVLTDRAKAAYGNSQPTKKILSISRSLKSRIVHNRCKSEIANSLKIIIP